MPEEEDAYKKDGNVTDWISHLLCTFVCFQCYGGVGKISKPLQKSKLSLIAFENLSQVEFLFIRLMTLVTLLLCSLV